jgi:hypothetical protein
VVPDPIFPLLAFVIYLWVFLGGIAGIVYGYSQWRRNGVQKDLNLLLLGLVAIAYVTWGLITRFLIISNIGNVPALLWSTKAVALVALVTGLALLYRQWKGSGSKK